MSTSATAVQGSTYIYLSLHMTSPSTVLCQTLFFQKSGNFIRAYFRDEAELLWTVYSVFVIKMHKTAHLNLCVAVIENRNTFPAINVIVGSADQFGYITITSGGTAMPGHIISPRSCNQYWLPREEYIKKTSPQWAFSKILKPLVISKSR